jgi:hypothetical protein
MSPDFWRASKVTRTLGSPECWGRLNSGESSYDFLSTLCIHLWLVEFDSVLD